MIIMKPVGKYPYYILFFTFILMTISIPCKAQSDPRDQIGISTIQITETIHILKCTNGFGGGNVTASIGTDGILLADNMFEWMVPKIQNELGKFSSKPIRVVINSHFHRDHIGGNSILRESALIVSHKNVKNRLSAGGKAKTPMTDLFPHLTFKDSVSIGFNGEEIKIVHFPNSHTDGDVIVYFTKSKVLHMGDMYFFGMFPAVYSQGGGNIHQLIRSIETIVDMIPADVKIIPGHGNIATKDDLIDYLTMLRETTEIVQSGIDQKKTLDQMKSEKVLSKYEALGSGGAQTTEEYLSMIYRLLTATEN